MEQEAREMGYRTRELAARRIQREKERKAKLEETELVKEMRMNIKIQENTPGMIQENKRLREEIRRLAEIQDARPKHILQSTPISAITKEKNCEVKDHKNYLTRKGVEDLGSKQQNERRDETVNEERSWSSHFSDSSDQMSFYKAPLHVPAEENPNMPLGLAMQTLGRDLEQTMKAMKRKFLEPSLKLNAQDFTDIEHAHLSINKGKEDNASQGTRLEPSFTDGVITKGKNQNSFLENAASRAPFPLHTEVGKKFGKHPGAFRSTGVQPAAFPKKGSHSCPQPSPSSPKSDNIVTDSISFRKDNPWLQPSVHQDYRPTEAKMNNKQNVQQSHHPASEFNSRRESSRTNGRNSDSHVPHFENKHSEEDFTLYRPPYTVRGSWMSVSRGGVNEGHFEEEEKDEVAPALEWEQGNRLFNQAQNARYILEKATKSLEALDHTLKTSLSYRRERWNKYTEIEFHFDPV